ncbi:Tensin-1 [Bulinus truncatus]|nr:Tensin-1 [Bulinus truncatus]
MADYLERRNAEQKSRTVPDGRRPRFGFGFTSWKGSYAMTFPTEGHDTTYGFQLKEAVNMLKTKHGENYLILNLSEKRQDLTKANPQVKEYGWPDHLAPPLERLCSLCKSVDSWLNSDIRNVVVLHCKGGRSRLASVIAAYLHYSNICASADQALDRFAMKRFYDEKLGGVTLPSQRRYVRYFSGLLSGAIKINSNPLYLHHILIHGVPNFDTKGGCRPFIKVYQGMQPIFTSGVYNVTDNMQKVCISISPGIPLRGDILIKCYHKKTRSGQREVIWQCQFHTCAISDSNLVFSKQELDDAVLDVNLCLTSQNWSSMVVRDADRNEPIVTCKLNQNFKCTSLKFGFDNVGDGDDGGVGDGDDDDGGVGDVDGDDDGVGDFDGGVGDGDDGGVGDGDGGEDVDGDDGCWDERGIRGVVVGRVVLINRRTPSP